jgi:hypothetical protein
MIGSRSVHLGELQYLREKGVKTNTKSHSLLGVKVLTFNLLR